MVVAMSKLRKNQTVTVTRGGKRLGSGKILEVQPGHILLMEIQRGGRLTQRIPLDGSEEYTVLRQNRRP